MKSFRREGKTVTYSNTGSAISSGDVVVMGALVGVACGDIAGSTGVGEVQIEGVFELTKLSTDVVAVGDRLYWDSGNSRLTKTPSTHAFAGVAVKAAGNGATTVEVKLLPDVESGNLSAAAAVADLGQTISGTYSQSEVQDISDKVDELLGAMRTARLLASS